MPCQNGEFSLMIKVYALLPMLNEESYAELTIKSLFKISVIDKIIVIDDGSSDKTWDILCKIKGIELIKHHKNMGKAKSIIDAINIYSDGDIYVFIDGDLGESAGKIQPLIDEVLKDNCDLCVARFPMHKNTGGVGFLRFFSRFVIKLITGTDFPCPLSGQRAVKKDAIISKDIKLYKGYGIEVGMLIDAFRNGFRVKFIDISLSHRVTGKSIKDYIHRIKQFIEITYVFIIKVLGW